MNLKLQKKLAAKLSGVSKKRIKLDEASFEDIKEAITKKDVNNLVSEGLITIVPKRGISRSRANKKQKQRSKGRQKGPGSRKGKSTARIPKKKSWMSKIRVQRTFLAELKEKTLLDSKTYRDLYLKAKGGFFRNKRHIKLYLEEHNLIKKKK